MPSEEMDPYETQEKGKKEEEEEKKEAPKELAVSWGGKSG